MVYLRIVKTSMVIVLAALLSLTGWSQDRSDRSSGIDLLPSQPAVTNINDVTVQESFLNESEYKAAGQTQTLTLQEAIDIALRYNPQMRTSRLSLDESLSNLDLTESDFRPKFNLDASVDERIRRISGGTFRIDPDRGLVSEIDKRYENNTFFSIGPTYRQEFKDGSVINIQPEFQFEHDSDGAFDRGPSNPSGNNYEDRYSVVARYDYPLNSRPRLQNQTQIENSKLSAVSSDYDLYLQEKTTVNSVINQYWNVKRLGEEVEIQRERLLQSKRVEFVIQTKYQFDDVSRQAVGEAQIDVLNNESSVIDVEGQYQGMMERLNLLLGIPVESNLILTDDIEVAPLSQPAEAYIELVTQHNLELKQLRIAIQQRENSLKIARLGQQPDLVLSAFGNANDEGSHLIGGALVFSWPFGDGGATRARVRGLEDQIERLKVNLWDLERQLTQETYVDLRNLQLQRQRIEIFERNVNQSYINVENGLYDFQNFGRISFRDLQDLQIELAQGRINLVRAKVSYVVAMAGLMQKIHEYSPTSEIEPLLNVLN